ncbi:hypothetical protein [Vibrio viridaestus]|uniref:Uncharacterized protein n=1 Tax=Vibrio viridaestus TaxID=2487322 RepID=A0A3N9TGN2_9VIBR|nr:hypothetical protein [Vibrio viridaestus]RQW63438.1 hypothetical protein EES38_09325 [Vibrio viridaestus]
MSSLFSLIKATSAGAILFDRATLSIAMGSGTTMGVGVAQGVDNYRSMLDSSLVEILAGNFVWYGSDIAFVVGTLLSTAGVAVSTLRWFQARHLFNGEDE